MKNFYFPFWKRGAEEPYSFLFNEIEKAYEKESISVKKLYQ